MGSVPPPRSRTGADSTEDQTLPGSRPFTPVRYSRYRLIAHVGAGGMAEVFLALMTGPEGFKRELVVKRILPQFTGNPEFVRMFINEAKISGLLTHPNIVQIYEFGEAEGTYFISMESVNGVTLREAMSKLRAVEQPMPFMVAAEIARQICVGLDYAHTLTGEGGVAMEIIHQDISPTNIMLAHNGTVKILDFGIARAAEFAEAEHRRGLIKGKVAYLSPEQLNRDVLDHRVDIFALGIVLHEMLTGVRLFQPKNDLARMRALLEQTIPPPSAVNALVPRELDRIVMKALQKDRERRYASAAVMANDLERTLIAARASSRDLSKLLAELYQPAGPVVIAETDTSGKPTGRLAPVASTPHAATATAHAPAPERPSPATPAAFHGAASAENVRLARRRWRAPIRSLLAAAAIVALATGAVTAWQRYGPGLLSSLSAQGQDSEQAPPAPSPRVPAVVPVDPKPAPARPATTRRQRGAAKGKKTPLPPAKRAVTAQPKRAL